jgi:hypothetical protein
MIVETSLATYAQLQALVEGQLVRHQVEASRDQIEGDEGHSGPSNGKEADLVKEGRADPSRDPQRNGVALLALCAERGMKEELFSLGKELKYARRFIEWSEQDTNHAYQVLFGSPANRNNRRRRATY